MNSVLLEKLLEIAWNCLKLLKNCLNCIVFAWNSLPTYWLLLEIYLILLENSRLPENHNLIKQFWDKMVLFQISYWIQWHLPKQTTQSQFCWALIVIACQYGILYVLAILWCWIWVRKMLWSLRRFMSDEHFNSVQWHWRKDCWWRLGGVANDEIFHGNLLMHHCLTSNW